MVEEGRLQNVLQRIYSEIATTMAGLMDARNMYIALSHSDDDQIEFPLVYEIGKLLPDENKVGDNPYRTRRRGERNGLTERLIREKEPLLISGDFNAWVARQPDIDVFPMGTKCWLGAPMMLGDRVIGVIGLQNFEREGVFDEGHRDLLVTIASQAAVAIENIRLQEERERELVQRAVERQRRLRLLKEISERLAAAGSSPDSVLELVVRASSDVTESDLTSVYLYDDNTSSLLGEFACLAMGCLKVWMAAN